jgi:hypothetical protein
VLAAIFGLVGVVVGALVTGGVDYYLDARREKRELKQARRIVGFEVAEIAIEAAVMGTQLRSGPDSDPNLFEGAGAILGREAWASYRDVLASRLDNENVWDRIAMFYLLVETTEGYLRELKVVPIEYRVDFLELARVAVHVLRDLEVRVPPNVTEFIDEESADETGAGDAASAEE